MALNDKHPAYAEFHEDWTLLEHAYRGERVIKSKGTAYLPPTSGMEFDGMQVNQPGKKAYDAYLLRAVFPDFVSEAVEAALGIMHCRPPQIDLPEQLEPLRDQASINGEGLAHLLRRINEQQLLKGRLGLMADMPVEPDQSNPLPYITMYKTLSIINWDDGGQDDERKPALNLVVLDETEFERSREFTWEIVDKYRVLALTDENGTPQQAGEYRTALFRDKDPTFVSSRMVAPGIRGQTLTKLPFVIINTKDLVANPDDPPLLGLARLCMTIYRGEADYRQNLFMQGQDTLVMIGVADDDDEKRVGAGSVVKIPMGGDAKYVGVQSQGLSEQREALQNDRDEALKKTGSLINSGGKEAESGDALRIRVASQTASLTQIALTGAAGLESILKTIAEWVGADPEKVKVTPNTEFDASTLDGKGLVDIMTAKTMGAPISRKSVHGMIKDRGMTTMEYEDELAEIESEEPLGMNEKTAQSLIDGQDSVAGGNDTQDGGNDTQGGIAA